MADAPTTNLFLKNLPLNTRVGDSFAEELLLREYGAVLVARGGAVPPDRIVFLDEDEVNDFQRSVETQSETIGGFEMELQAAAMVGLRNAIAAAAATELTITPRGADSARRCYSQTIELWASRVEPALEHWQGLGRIMADTVEKIRSLSPFEQVPEVLALESKGIWFAKDLSKSIIYSVAPPGASQHLSMLAFDCAEFNDPKVRELLSKHGWFQTVVSDLPHFTYIGVSEEELPSLGLKRLENGERVFWVPDI